MSKFESVQNGLSISRNTLIFRYKYFEFTFVGYAGYNGQCCEVDPCFYDTQNDCSSEATCTNIDPINNRLICTCKEGFTGSGVKCTGYRTNFFL